MRLWPTVNIMLALMICGGLRNEIVTVTLVCHVVTDHQRPVHLVVVVHMLHVGCGIQSFLSRRSELVCVRLESNVHVEGGVVFRSPHNRIIHVDHVRRMTHMLNMRW